MISKRSSLHVLFYKPVENTQTSIEQQIFLLMFFDISTIFLLGAEISFINNLIYQAREKLI